MTTYAASCLGTGREPCDWHGTDPGADLAARKHEAATGHATTTYVVGGPYDTARVERKP